MLYFITKSHQLMKVMVSLDGLSIENNNFDYVHEHFHNSVITGMDICLRKQLIATCSGRDIKIWNYATKRLEIQAKLLPNDETFAIAFHPSGFHLIVATADKITMMHCMSSTIKDYNSIPMKGCREIRFSRGGHLFACAQAQGNIFIYNFWTGECPQNMQLKGHN